MLAFAQVQIDQRPGEVIWVVCEFACWGRSEFGAWLRTSSADLPEHEPENPWGCRLLGINEWLADRGLRSIDWCLVQLRQGLCVGRGASASISTLKSNPS